MVKIEMNKKMLHFFERNKKGFYICNRIGGMAEWSNAAVLKTVEGHTSGGSNPSSSADNKKAPKFGAFLLHRIKSINLSPPLLKPSRKQDI